MNKITFMGAGSTVFVRNVLGDCMCSDALKDWEYALYDIDATRLEESYEIISAMNETKGGHARITKHLGVENRKEALRGARFVINAIQVGLYDPCTIIDFEVPKKYGLRQTIGDTLGIGGIMRALRTIPVMDDFAKDMREVCPNALFLNYTNPMAMLSGYMQRYTGVQTVGLCHSVQTCAQSLLKRIGMEDKAEGCDWKIAGINHMAWLLEIRDRDGNDLYPEIKRRALAGPIKDPLAELAMLYPEYAEVLNARTPELHTPDDHDDMVRFELMKQFGYYVTESSEHSAEYYPYFIKKAYPELIERYNIPLDEYPRRCIAQTKAWKAQAEKLIHNENLTHTRSNEYAASIIEAIETGKPFSFGGNVMNTGLIDNLPADCCVEVTCLANEGGIQPCHIGALPHQLAALNLRQITVHQVAVDAALTGKKDYIYQAAMLDPHASAELSIDEIRAMVDDLIEAHGDWLPKYH